jgi:UDP-N-acetylmuramate: L-alanyl-gamma-D-glutamyl-meso-diaminopimelate ligase
MVQLSDDAPIIIIEDDRYLASPIDRPKFPPLPYRGYFGHQLGPHQRVFRPGNLPRAVQFSIRRPRPAYSSDRDDEQTQLVTVPSSPDVKYGLQLRARYPATARRFAQQRDEEMPVFGREHNLRNISAARKCANGARHQEPRRFYEALASFKESAATAAGTVDTRGHRFSGVQDFARMIKATATAFKNSSQAPAGGLPGTAPSNSLNRSCPVHTFDAPRRGGGVLQPCWPWRLPARPQTDAGRFPTRRTARVHR